MSVVPRLRFPEFKDGWRYSALGEVVDTSREKSTIQDQYEVLTSARTGLMRQVDYYGDGRITGRNNVGYNIIPSDHVTYRSRTDDGRFYFNHNNLGSPGIISTFYPVIHSRSGSNPFLATLLNRYSPLIGTHSVGTSQRVLSLKALLRINFPIPCPAEQVKIASCLGSLDDLIAAEGRKLEALRRHKQGLMAQLFPRGDESVPRLRFPEFRDAGHWERAPLSELCEIRHGYPFEGKLFSDEGEYVLLTPGNFNEQGGYRDRGEKQKYYIGKIPRDYVLDRGDLLVAMTEQAAGLLGSSLLVLDSDKFLHNQRLGLVTRKSGVAWNNRFFFYVFNTQPVRRAISRSASGMKVRHTSPTKIGQVVVSFPASQSEQERVADCLSALDVSVAAQTGRLDALKQHKHGLVQQLFPALEGEAQ